MAQDGESSHTWQDIACQIVTETDPEKFTELCDLLDQLLLEEEQLRRPPVGSMNLPESHRKPDIFRER